MYHQGGSVRLLATNGSMQLPINVLFDSTKLIKMILEVAMEGRDEDDDQTGCAHCYARVFPHNAI
jgi:hypothetical protein